jgi:hypothetical protein
LRKKKADIQKKAIKKLKSKRECNKLIINEKVRDEKEVEREKKILKIDSTIFDQVNAHVNIDSHVTLANPITYAII